MAKLQYNTEIAKEMQAIVDMYSLHAKGNNKLFGVQKIRAFVENNKQNMEIMKSYLNFVDSCPFQLQEPVVDAAGKTWLIQTLIPQDQNGMISWSRFDAIDNAGTVKEFKIDELKKYSAKVS